MSDTEPVGNENTGASSGDEGSAPASTPDPQPAAIAETAKVEIKEGKVMVDGKAFVAEQHLIANKKSLEGKLETAQTVHDTAIDKAKLALSEAQQNIATLNAKIKETDDARSTGAATDEEAASVKQELETAKSSIVTLTADAAKALELQRANLVLKYGIAPDTIAEKDMPALDSFEEALKAVATVKGGGVGPYAVGGEGTGAVVPDTNIERAAKVLEATAVRGVRNEPPPAK